MCFFLFFLVKLQEGLSVYQSVPFAGRYVVTVCRAACEPAKLPGLHIKSQLGCFNFHGCSTRFTQKWARWGWERSQGKACGDFGQILIRPRIASCKVKALERCRRCRTFALQFAQFTETKLVSKIGVWGDQKPLPSLQRSGCWERTTGSYPKLSKCVFVCRHVCFCGCIKWVKVADQF